MEAFELEYLTAVLAVVGVPDGSGATLGHEMLSSELLSSLSWLIEFPYDLWIPL